MLDLEAAFGGGLEGGKKSLDLPPGAGGKLGVGAGVDPSIWISGLFGGKGEGGDAGFKPHTRIPHLQTLNLNLKP